MADLTTTELTLGLIGCVFAVLIGAWMAKKQAHAFSHQHQASSEIPMPVNNDLPVVTFVDYGDMRFLHLGTPSVQGSMKIGKPFEIHLEYVQRMMGWMLFANLEKINQMHAMQLGLGAASLTKFCHHHLKMQTTAIELNPQVISVCRRWFDLPADDEKLQVILADAETTTSSNEWLGKIDALQIDLYDQDAARPVLDSESFYRNCRNLLTSNGCMTVNLFGHSYSYEDSLEKICTVFGSDAVWTFKPTAAGNAIVLALRTPRILDQKTLSTQAQIIQSRWPLAAQKWLKALRPSSHKI